MSLGRSGLSLINNPSENQLPDEHCSIDVSAHIELDRGAPPAISAVLGRARGQFTVH